MTGKEYDFEWVASLKTLKIFYQITKGDFRVSSDYFGNFYLKNIADYSRDVSSLYYNAFTNDFNAMDYDKQVLI